MRNGALFAIEKSSGEAIRVRSDQFEGFMYGRYKSYFKGAGCGDSHMRVMIAGIERSPGPSWQPQPRRVRRRCAADRRRALPI